MKWRTFEIQREPGFRFNLIDLLLILFLCAVSIAGGLLFPVQYLYLLPLYVGGSFFLFCNVFRIGNRLEPWWYVCFLVLVIEGMTHEEFPWARVLIVCEVVKLVLITYQIRRGAYVGAFYRQLRRYARPARIL